MAIRATIATGDRDKRQETNSTKHSTNLDFDIHIQLTSTSRSLLSLSPVTVATRTVTCTWSETQITHEEIKCKLSCSETVLKASFNSIPVPPNGLVIYCGTIVTEEGKEKKVNIDFEPFKPINTSLYLCDNKFHTEALTALLADDNKFGFIVMDGNGALFGTLQGNTREVSRLKSFINSFYEYIGLVPVKVSSLTCQMGCQISSHVVL